MSSYSSEFVEAALGGARHWTRFVPFSPLILSSAEAEGVDARFLATVVAAETGGTFSPFAFAPEEEGLGLGQLQRRYSEPFPDGNWWDPSVNLARTARHVAELADRIGVPARPSTYLDVYKLRAAYTHGAAGFRQRWARRGVDWLLGLRSTRVIHDWTEALAHPERPASVWHGTLSPKRGLLPHLDRPAGAPTSWELGPWPLEDIAADARLLHAAMPSLSLQVDGVTHSFPAWADMIERSAALPQSWGPRLGGADLRANRRRVLVLLAKCAFLIDRYTPLGATLSVTSLFRERETAEVAARVRNSQHLHGLAADLGLSVAKKSAFASPHSVARLLRAWALGPTLRELGGLGVYRHTPSMVHVDARSRSFGRISAWYWDYPMPVF